MIDNLKYNKMLEEYRRGGKFNEYVNKCMQTYGTNLQEELRKTITWEYFKSVSDAKGCNYDRELHENEDYGV